MQTISLRTLLLLVALLAEGGDRNGAVQFAAENDSEVALLAEGVDRNSLVIVQPRSARVALLAEGVDRNIAPARYALWSVMSPSSRRAWIEIGMRHSP